jgi:DTW domain-containing protein YfiP
MNKRATCPNCEYILARCLCNSLQKIDNKTQIIILQHPSESSHALNTARLMTKSFLKIKLFIGEDFSDHEELNELIKTNKESIALIFPKVGSPILTSEMVHISHLIFIDGTWKKARKIYLLSKNLTDLPTYSLETLKESQYKIRSSEFSKGLSTLEASLLALGKIEKDLETISLEEAFLKMINFQIEKMGEETYRKNYEKKKSDE